MRVIGVGCAFVPRNVTGAGRWRLTSGTGGLQRRATDAVHALHRRITNALIGTPLRRDGNIERTGSLLHRNPDHKFTAIRFHVLVKRLVEVNLACGQLRFAKRRRATLHRKRKPLAIHVIAICDFISHVDFARFLRGAEFERDGGVEKIVGGMAWRNRSRAATAKHDTSMSTASSGRRAEKAKDLNIKRTLSFRSNPLPISSRRICLPRDNFRCFIRMIRFDKARQFVAACEARLEQELKLLGSLDLTFPPIPRLHRRPAPSRMRQARASMACCASVDAASLSGSVVRTSTTGVFTEKLRCSGYARNPSTGRRQLAFSQSAYDPDHKP